jgi:hypothetical protein
MSETRQHITPVEVWQIRRLPRLAALLLVHLIGCAGYQVGTRTLYRPDVSTVSVPIFESDSLRRDLGERLTEAVVKEIELKTPYKVVDGLQADSILFGRILRDSKYVVAENINDEPRDIELELRVEAAWRDRRGDLIAEVYTVGVPSLLVGFGQAVHLVPEGGQSLATAQLQAIERLAEQIVAQMEVPW